MISLHDWLEREDQSGVTMIMQVHDELVFEVPPDELQEAARLIKEIMEGVWQLKVPLKVNVAEGMNWDEAH